MNQLKLTKVSLFTLFLFALTNFCFGQKTLFFNLDSARYVNPWNIIQTDDGNFMIGATEGRVSQAIEQYPDNQLVLKFTPNADTIWQKYYPISYYAAGRLIKTKVNYGIYFSGSRGLLCDGFLTTYPFYQLSMREFDADGIESSDVEGYSQECSTTMYSVSTLNNENYFILYHSDNIHMDGRKYYEMLILDSLGNQSFVDLPSPESPQFVIAHEAGLIVYNYNSLQHIERTGSLIESYDYDSTIAPGKHIGSIVNQDTLIVVTARHSPPYETRLRQISFEGSASNFRTYQNFNPSKFLKSKGGKHLLSGTTNDTMAVMVLDHNFDSLTTIKYPQVNSSSASDIFDIDGDNFILSGSIGSSRAHRRGIIIFDSISNHITNIFTPSINTAQLFVYPNPANETIHLNLLRTLGNVKVEIFDLTGRFILQTEITNNHPIDVSNLSAGTYVIKANSGNNVATRRLVIER